MKIFLSVFGWFLIGIASLCFVAAIIIVISYVFKNFGCG